MRAARLDKVTALTYLALSAAIIMLPPSAFAQTLASVDSGVPLPEPANVPPPGISDIGPAPSAPAAPPAQAAPAAAPAAVQSTALSAADQQVADKLRDTFAAKSDRIFDDRKDRAAAEEFYKARAFAPIWIESGVAGERMKAAIARLKNADADGLVASDYALPDAAALGSDADGLAQAELRFTASVLQFARHAQAGRTTPSRLSPNIDVTPPVPESGAVLKAVSEAKDATAALDGFNPPHEGFRLLKAKLVELRGSAEDTVIQIASGPVVKRGKKDARIPALRQRLHIEGDADNFVYDEALSEAVKAFQRERGLTANGILTPATVDALNGRSKSKQIDTVVSNMERWRWLPRDLGKAYVMVNVPDFTLKLMDGGHNKFSTRIIVGKANTPSPMFSDEIENIVVNPSWHVPESIVYGEYGNMSSEALAARGYEVSYRRDGTMSIRQPPGERNALGRLKFNFPNAYQVYLHDTPTKHLFAQDHRAFSHGCMRVQNPEKFGEALLSVVMPQEGYTAQKLTRMYGRNEVTLKFKNTVPVHIVYMNAYVDDAGKLVVRDDVYGYDKRTQSALAGKYMVVSERSQKVTPGSSSKVRRAYQARRQGGPDGPNGRQVADRRGDAPARRPQQEQGGFFLFPFLR